MIGITANTERLILKKRCSSERQRRQINQIATNSESTITKILMVTDSIEI